MKFLKDETVVSADGKTIGKVDRVVLDPNTYELTHIVVRKGVFLTHDRVVPREAIRDNVESPITLNMNADDANALPELEESYYRPLDGEELTRATAMYPATVPAAELYLSPAVSVAPANYTLETQRNVPDDTVTIKSGVRVVAQDGEHVGQVDQVITSNSSDKITHLVISHGMLTKEKKLVPMSWIDLITDEEVKLNVPLARLEKLDAYQAA